MLLTEHDFFTYTPSLTKEEDFDSFWQETKATLETIPLAVEREAYDYPSELVDVFKVSYQSLFNERIHGWYIVPKSVTGPIPCVIEYIGFMNQIGEPMSFLHWASMGYAVLVFDVRSQGGRTGDSAPYTAPYLTHPLTLGIRDQYQYYQRRLFSDAVRAVDVAESLPEVDNQFIVLSGTSQGGALTMAAAALAGDRAFMALADVPSSSNVFDRIENERGSFSGVADYLRKYPNDYMQVMKVQSYFDTMNFADWITCPVVASVGGKDPICPAKNYFATYNRITTPKEIYWYPYNGHEGGSGPHLLLKMKRLKQEIDRVKAN